MQIKPILARLQSALGRDDLIQQMALLPESSKSNRKSKSGKTVKLVVGYNGSPNSQTALDVTLWIAHQTRLATQKQVVVHVVYVVDTNDAAAQSLPSNLPVFDAALETVGNALCDVDTEPFAQGMKRLLPHPAVLTKSHFPVPGAVGLAEPECVIPNFQPMDALEHADYVLWQARCMAEEWRGSLEAHLCFGDAAAELRRVVEAEGADLLLLGCATAGHPLVKQLSSHFPCPILGIPSQLHCAEERTAACS